MKKSKTLFTLLLAGALMASCGGAKEGNEGGKDNTKTAQRPLTVAMATEIDSLDPFNATAGDTKTVMDQIFDGLLDVDEDGNLVADLAESYEISEDGLTYTFKLKEGVKFHDGSDFSADDVYYTYDKLSGLSSGEPMSSKFSVIKEMEVVSPTEITMTLDAVNNSFIYLQNQPIVKKDYEDNQTKPVGTGPYKFVSYTPGEGMVMERFDDYHRKDHIAKIKQVNVVRIADNQALVMALNNGEVDLASKLTADELTQVSESTDSYSHPQNLVQLLGLNNKVKPFDDIRVRQAIAHAIDKDELIEAVAGGKASKIYSSFSPALKDYYNDLEEMYPTDVEKAKELLAEAGYPDGISFKMTVPSDYKFHMDTAELIQAQLKKAGINATIDPIEFSTWLDRVYKDKDYETTIAGFIGYTDPIRVLDRYVSTNDKNYLNYESEDYDKAISNAMATLDRDELIKSVKDAQEIISRDCAAVFLQDPNDNIVLNKQYKGLKTYPVQKLNIEDIDGK